MYDPAVIETYCKRLLDRANRIVQSWSALGAIFGGIALFMVTSIMGGHERGRGDSGLFILWFGVGGAIGFYIGRAIGETKAESLRLAAQTVLVQLQIERNTRPPKA